MSSFFLGNSTQNEMKRFKMTEEPSRLPSTTQLKFFLLYEAQKENRME